MTDRPVNVRAAVRARPTGPDASGEVPGWEVYDHDSNDDGSVTIRCDQLVRASGRDVPDLVENAKASASSIIVEGHEIEDVTLWVDTDIDIDPEYATTAPSP